MTLPNRSLTVQNGGLGVSVASDGPVFSVLGPSTIGPYITPASYRSPTSLAAVFGRGPAVRLAKYLLDKGGGTCVFVRTESSTAATTTTGAATQDAASTGSCAISGDPNDNYRIAVEIVKSGDVGVAVFKWSIDAGPDDTNEEKRNWSSPVTVPAGGAYTIQDTGAIITFTGGAATAFTLGDVFYYSTTAPAYTLLDLNDGIDALRDSDYDVDWIQPVGEVTAAIAAGVETKMSSWKSTYHRDSFAVLEAADLDPIGAVTAGGTTPPGMTATGIPLESWDFVVDLDTPGVLGTATFKYSTDGGRSWSAAITTTVATGINPISGTGIILTFAAGMHNADNEYSFSTWDKEVNRAVWDTALRAAYVNVTFTSDRVLVCAGFGEATHPDGQIKRTSIAWGVGALLAKTDLSTDLGQVEDAGPLPGFLTISHDEEKATGLDDVGFCVARTWLGVRGIYCNQGRIMCAPGSDYDLVQYRRVMDKACKVLDSAMARDVNKKIIVNMTTGKILETVARGYDRKYDSIVRAATVDEGHASGLVVAVDRDENILSTREFAVDFELVGVAYIKNLIGRIGFVNPAIGG